MISDCNAPARGALPFPIQFLTATLRHAAPAQQMGHTINTEKCFEEGTGMRGKPSTLPQFGTVL
jgi:hypothetical protein